MLTIGQNVYRAIVAHARAEHPIAACGLVAGRIGSDRPTRCVPVANTRRSADFWEFDPVEQFKAWREMDRRGEEPVIIYHSNPFAEAYPSRADVRYFAYPDAHFVVLSGQDATGPGTSAARFRSFHITDGTITEESVVIEPEDAGPAAVEPEDANPTRF